MNLENLGNIPETLKSEPRWIVWRTEYRENKPTKVPYRPFLRNIQLASSNNPRTWGLFGEAIEAYQETKEYDGIGFMLGESSINENHYCGIDLDKCFGENGQLSKFAANIADQINSYTELSPSGNGLHIICCAKKPGNRAKANIDGNVIEIYDKARYFTITGGLLHGFPGEIYNRQAEIEKLYFDLWPEEEQYQKQGESEGFSTETENEKRYKEANNLDDIALIHKAMSNPKTGLKFSQLWHGNISGYASHSEADLALCSYLAFWTGCDGTRINRLFCISALYRKDKWGREDYQQRTIAKAISESASYDPNYRGNETNTEREAPTDSMQSAWDSLCGITADSPEELQAVIKEKLWDLSGVVSQWNQSDFGRFADRLSHRFKIPKTWITDWRKSWGGNGKNGQSHENEEKSAIQLADDFIAQHYTDDKQRRTLAYQNDSWYAYEGTKYAEISKAEFHTRLAAHVRDDGSNDISVNLINSIKLAVQPVTMIPDQIFMPCWRSTLTSAANVVSLENGILDLSKEIAGDNKPLQAHTPDCILLSSQPYRFNPSADYPRWLQFLNESLPDLTLQAILQEFFGLCLTHDQRFHCFLFIHGESRTGKGVTLETLQALVGEDNVENLSLRSFGSDFGFESSIGKKVNITTEVPELEKVDEDILKEYTGGSSVFRINRKHKTAIHTTQRMKLAMSSNHLPQFRDRSQGLWNRMLFIPFEKVTENEDLDLKAYLAENELSGIFNWAIQGYQRLTKQGGFTQSDRMKKEITDYQRDSIPAQDFFNAYLVIDGDLPFAVHGKTLYRYYRLWAQCEGKRPQGAISFGRDVSAFVKMQGIEPVRDRYGYLYPRLFLLDEAKELIVERAINNGILRLGQDEYWKYNAEDGKYDYGPNCQKPFDNVPS